MVASGNMVNSEEHANTTLKTTNKATVILDTKYRPQDNCSIYMYMYTSGLVNLHDKCFSTCTHVHELCAIVLRHCTTFSNHSAFLRFNLRV